MPRRNDRFLRRCPFLLSYRTFDDDIQTESRKSALVCEGVARFWDRKAESHQIIERSLLYRSPGLPSRDCGFSDSQANGEIPRLQSEGLPIPTDLFGRQEPDLAAKSDHDLIICPIVENDRSTVRTSGGVEFGNFNRVGSTVVLNLG
jgi:hypothetical protein